MVETPQYVPDEVWDPDDPSFVYDIEVNAAIDQQNRFESASLIDVRRTMVKTDDEGITYAVIRDTAQHQTEDYSETDAVVLFNSFANGATPNNLVRADLVRQTLEQADVRDEAGKLLPVVMVASPVRGSQPKLKDIELRDLRDGRFNALARKYMKRVESLGFGRVAIRGFSQGADMAMAAGIEASRADLDATSVVVGDPAGVEKRTRWQLLRDFTSSGSAFQRVIERSPVEAQGYALRGSGDMRAFVLSAMIRTNRALFEGLTYQTFETRLQHLEATHSIGMIAVGYGSLSRVTQPSSIEPMMQFRAIPLNGTRLHTIRVDGRGHEWADELGLIAQLYLKGLR